MTKRRRILSVIIVATILAMLVATPLLAQPPGLRDKTPPGLEDKQPPGLARVSPHATTRLIDVQQKGKDVFATYEMVIDSIPATLADGVTLIDPVWYYLEDDGGQRWYESGANTFTARVLGGRVSLESEGGHLAIWNPKVTLGNQVFSGGTATVVADLWNENYHANTLLWEYGTYSTGVWPFKHHAQVKRYLRMIEGHIAELWVLPIDPRTDVTIELNRQYEHDFTGDVTWLYAHDADGRSLKVEQPAEGVYVIKASEFRGKTYPVTIDPTVDFVTASANDALLYAFSPVYSTARQKLDDYISHQAFVDLGQAYDDFGYGLEYAVLRLALVWDTSSLPDDAVVTSGQVDIYTGSVSGTHFYITIQGSGDYDRPSVPVVKGDYFYAWYDGDGGSKHTTEATLGGYTTIPLNSVGRSWVDPTGYTRFILRSSKDIAATAPTGYENIGVYQREQGTGFAPRLSLTYTIPIAAPTVTTLTPNMITPSGANLRGTLSDDGGEPCSVNFRYGPTTAVAYQTAIQDGKTTGVTFNAEVAGLDAGTLYYVRAQASNSGGSTLGSLVSFYTLPYAPNTFTATSGDTEIDLAWAKGTGADKTMIRRSTTAYPTSPTSGTQVYFNTGTAYTNTGLTNGTTYYYSAWSEVSGTYSDTYVKATAAPSAPQAPSITTNDATSVTTSAARLNSYLTSLHGAASADVSFEWHAEGDVPWSNETARVTYYGATPHYADLTGRADATLHHFRARAESVNGINHGAEKTFTTGAIHAPTMTTQAATGTLQTSSTIHGKVTAWGGAYVTAWFEWGLTAGNLANNTPTIAGLETNDEVYYGLSGLDSNTTYYFRVAGENSAGKGYGATLNFTTTTAAAPTVATNPASVGAALATLQGTVLTDGAVECEVRFQWGLNTSYGTDTAWLGGYTAGQAFTQIISGLELATTYHFRAQARNEGGTASGSDVTFTTVFTAPTDFRAKAISHTTINLEWTKTGDQTMVRYKQGGYPIDRADGDLAYFGAASTASVSGLSVARTYYFRAWSWRDGNIWADGYASDAATTLGVVDPTQEEEPGMVLTPTQPSTWFQVPSGAALTKLPLYDNFVAFADSYGIPQGTMWFNVVILLTIVAGAITYLKVRSPVVTVFVAGFTIVACTMLGMAPLWILLVYALLGGGLIYVTHRM